MPKLYRLRSTVRQIYGGRSLLPGDPFPDPVEERVALPLIKMHFASEMPEDAAPTARKRLYQRRDLQAEK